MSFLDWFRKGPPRSAEELLAEARALTAQGKFQDAVRVYSRLPSRALTAPILADMGWACLSAEDVLGALRYASEALRASPHCAEAMCIQGEVLLGEGRKGDALERFHQALRLSPDCERACRRAAELEAPPKKAEASAEAAPRRTDEALARTRVADGMSAAAKLQAQGRHAEALPLARQAALLAQAHLGEEHHITARSLHRLGLVLLDMGDPTEARPHLEQALAISRKALGEDDPDTARGLHGVGMLLQATADDAGAKAAYDQALVIGRAALGKEHPDIAIWLSSLGSLLLRMGDEAGAKACQGEAETIRRKMAGEPPTDETG